MKPIHRRTPLAAALLLLGLACATGATGAQPSASRDLGTPTWCADRCDAVVTDWNLGAYQVIKAADGYADPLMASRALAMMHLAMHDAANAAQPRYQRYAEQPRSGSAARADAAVAAATAAHDVLAALYPQAPAAALLTAELDRTLLQAGTGPEVAAGSALGHAAAAAVLAKRADDGSAGSETYVEGTAPGEYRFTPGFDFAAAPHWRHVTPFALQAPSQFRTAPAPALTSAEYRRDFNEVKRVGAENSTARRADETHYAAFWYEFSDIGWNRVARAAAGRVEQDLWERARTFALLNVAMADAYIAGWDSKYLHNAWRPVTAIALAADDGHPLTRPDPAFAPLMPTPPVPDMPSTHSALGMAAATVLAHGFGRDRVPFSFASSSALPANPVRAYGSFSEAAIENAESRVKAGIHFRFATDAGLALGRQIGRYVAQTALPPEPARLAQRD